MENIKQCFKCGDSKKLTDFYKHKKMGDGYLGKCKACTRNDSKLKLEENKKNPEWVEKEKLRGINKQRAKAKTEIGKIQLTAYNKMRPLRNLPENKDKELHHWSYLEDHHLDIIPMTKKDHRKIHRYIKLDIERLQFRDLRGVLMDDKERAIKEYTRILTEEED